MKELLRINTKFYKIYNLIIRSEILLHSSLIISNTLENNYDVDISFGKIIKDDKKPLYDYGIFKYYKNRINITIKDVASYDIINGSKIVVEPIENADINEISKYICGSCLGLLLFQRNTIVLHGGALCINNSGVVISGNVGAGKSTLVSNFINMGYPFLSDDVSAIITNENNKNYITHSFPQQKLCKDTALSLGYDLSQLYQIDKIKDKYYSPIISNFSTTPCEFKYFFYISCGDYPKLNIKEVLGIEKFQTLISNIYRIEVIPNNLLSPVYVKKILNLSSNIKIFKINRPKNIDTLREITSLIQSCITNERSTI